MTNTKKAVSDQESDLSNIPANNTTICGISLIKTKNKDALVSSQTIANGAGVKHQAIVKLSNKHQAEIEKHGDWSGFKIQSRGQKKEAFFNEEQASFILMLLRNTAQVVRFKSALVSAFYKLRRKHEILMDRHAKLEYQQNRLIDKFHRRDMTDIIKPFAEYSISQGSKGAKFLYSNITRWTNKACGIESIETADELQLSNHSTACDIVAVAINKGMAKTDNYKDVKLAIKYKLGVFGSLLRQGSAK